MRRCKVWLQKDWVIFSLFFFVLTVVLCYSILLDPAGHLAAKPVGDKGTNLWNLWWVYYALFHLLESPLRCELIFHPWGCALRYHTLSLFNGIIASPVTALGGPVVAYNVLFFAWTWLTGVCAALWARTYQASLGAACFIGFLAAFGAYRWAHQIHLNLFSTPLLFLALYFWEKYLSAGKKIAAVAFCLSWLFAALSAWYYAVFIGMYWALRGAVFIYQRPKNRENLFRVIWGGLAVVPPLLMTFFYFHNPANGLEHAVKVDEVSIVVSSYWSFDVLHLIFPAWLARAANLPIETKPEFCIHPGIAVFLFCGLFGCWGWIKKRGFFSLILPLICLSVTFFILSLGPVLKCNDSTPTIMGFPIILPAWGFEWIPFITVMRVYTRFALIGFLTFCLLGCLGFDAWVGHKGFGKRRWVVFLVLAVVTLVEAGWRPPRMYQYSIPSQIKQIKKGPVLELPYLPTKVSGTHLYHQTIHHQPIYVAEFSRLSSYKRAYLKEWAIINKMNMYIMEYKKGKPSDFPLEHSLCNDLKQLKVKNIAFSTSKSKRIEEIHEFILRCDKKIKVIWQQNKKK